ncbi:hypothetical protein [Desulfohalobium retbaense]|uniref:SHOCT domain-containing protein n=1 Tax=Desulfohalobium retbaense (strain ATCC 49708 / DSM 5692 / JCM 16813 / HR100) TaxID=485915 RepID=C8X0X9_DESRD|nr:hypothetical protein [Desulfohalobium retbaense]ACV68076.1 hypothetical protein Dret_0784 [Desulfohalobium retbaense DSM 5692]
MNRRTLLNSFRHLAKHHGKQIARKVGNSTLDRVSKRLRDKGYPTHSITDIDTVIAELKRMHSEGRLTAEEFKRVRRELVGLWKDRS